MNDMKSQHDPTKMQKVGTNDNIEQNTPDISMDNNNMYPDGVFVLNGILKIEIHLKLSCHWL